MVLLLLIFIDIVNFLFSHKMALIKLLNHQIKWLYNTLNTDLWTVGNTIWELLFNLWTHYIWRLLATNKHMFHCTKLYSEYIKGYNPYDTSLLNLALANDVLGFQQCSLKACHKLQKQYIRDMIAYESTSIQFFFLLCHWKFLTFF